jgi:SsrA-binding protein
MAIMAAKKKEKDPHKTATIQNRKAYHEYAIEETVEAGIVLTGTEVKSLRQGQANLAEAYCKFQNGEMWIQHFHISPYEEGNIYNVDPDRPRKLLLHRYQIVKLQVRIQEKGLTVIPTKLYFTSGRAKVEIGVGRGRKLWDQRDRIAGRDQDREMRRELASRQRED